jgi:hypothetical protein
MNSSIGKWLAGIAASIIAALIIWFLTHAGGPLNRGTPIAEDKPILRIVDFHVTDAPLGGIAHATVSVFNEGKATGEACRVWWYSGSDVGKELAAGKSASKSATSHEFGLPPGQTSVVEPDSLMYTELGMFRSYVQASCAGADITSTEYYKDVAVKP